MNADELPNLPQMTANQNSQSQVVKRGRGAPSKKTAAICEAICEGIAEGKSARAMCIEVGITQKTLWSWLSNDTEFIKQYARAKEKCADHIADEILEIADESANDWQISEDGSRYVDNEAVQRSRLRIDARKWYASKIAPKKYGDKVVNELQGGDPDKPITHSIAVTFIRPNPPKTE